VVVDVHIPAHAFDYLGMKEKMVIATDLLTRERLAMALHRDGGIRMEIAARSGRVWKIKL
jgi:hypothetical protein